MDRVVGPSPFIAASTIELFVMAFLQCGHTIGFSIIFPFSAALGYVETIDFIREGRHA
jgi:hypothetical protein